LDAEEWVVDVKVLTPPAEKGISETEESKNAKQSGSNHAAYLETEPGAIGKCMERVGWSFFVIVLRDDDLAGCERLLSFWVAKLRNSQ